MSAFESSNAADNVLASGTGAALLTPDDFEDDQIAELEDCDDWGKFLMLSFIPFGLSGLFFSQCVARLQGIGY